MFTVIDRTGRPYERFGDAVRLRQAHAGIGGRHDLPVNARGR